MSASISAAASARRSLPEACSALVIRASRPASRTARKILSSSVATTARETPRAASARSTTCRIIGRPAISSKGFPGKRLEE
jgi:hypothetical protein